MGEMKTLLMVLAFGALLAYYLRLPPPPLSERLQEWQSSGYYFKFDDAINVFYKDTAPGKPPATSQRTGGEDSILLVIHGFPTNTFDWYKVWPDLDKHFDRVIAPDLLGFGFTDKSALRKYTIFEQADMVEALLIHLKIQHFHILAHDYGDTVAQELVFRYEERRQANKRGLNIVDLCMLNGGMFPETNFPTPLQKVGAFPYVGPVISRLVFFTAFEFGIKGVFGEKYPPTEEELREFWAVMNYNQGLSALHELLQYSSQRRINRERWVGALQRASIPIFTIYGDADKVNPPPFAERYRELLPSAGIVVLRDVGHFPQMEAPARVVEEYFNFLKRVKPQVR